MTPKRTDPPVFTAKHFRYVAHILRSIPEVFFAEPQCATRENLSIIFADYLGKTNPRFKRQHFLKETEK